MLFLRLFKESVLFALNALVVNKLRTFLSLLGISIGIFTIITVFTLVDSLENNLNKSVQKLGNDAIYVQNGLGNLEAITHGGNILIGLRHHIKILRRFKNEQEQILKQLLFKLASTIKR